MAEEDATEEDYFHGKREVVHAELWLYRVEYGGKVNHLVAAHSYTDACAAVRVFWPRRKKKKPVVWASAGPANDHNLKGWKKQVINAAMAAVQEAP